MIIAWMLFLTFPIVGFCVLMRWLFWVAWLEANGGIKYNKVIYDSPSAVGAAIRDGKSTNGWRFWRYKNDQGELVCIGTLRK